jgi:hypothetical protein
MNPYEILSVSPDATTAEIKAAYRKLVKQFHPDVASGKIHDEKIRQINEAYDILSDIHRKALFDNRYAKQETAFEEDPREVYRREYVERKRKETALKREQARQRQVKTVAREKKVYRVVRLLTFPILAFAIVLEIDRFLPVDIYEEVGEVGWQKRYGGRRGSGHGELYSFMQTQHFTMGVPDELHVNYDYWADEKERLIVAASPLLRTPLSVTYRIDNQRYIADVDYTIYTQVVPLHYFLLASALFTVVTRKYSRLTYSLCFLPMMLLFFVLMIMF